MEIKEIAKVLGINKKLSMNVVRHTFAMLALNNGVNIYSLKELLGHTSVKTTEICAKSLLSTIINELNKFQIYSRLYGYNEI